MEGDRANCLSHSRGIGTASLISSRLPVDNKRCLTLLGTKAEIYATVSDKTAATAASTLISFHCLQLVLASFLFLFCGDSRQLGAAASHFYHNLTSSVPPTFLSANGSKWLRNPQTDNAVYWRLSRRISESSDLKSERCSCRAWLTSHTLT